jgi:lysozyme
MAPPWGPDVSEHQGAVDWPAVARAGASFAWCKATEGLTFVDHRFRRNWPAIREAGLVRGAYHFARPQHSAAAEAEHFVSVVRDAGFDQRDHLCLDLEAGDGALGAWAARFLDRVAEMTGLAPSHLWLYSGAYFYRDHGLSAVPAKYRRWIASYGAKPIVAYEMWQHTSSGACAGIAGRCDLSWGPADMVTFGPAPSPPATPETNPIGAAMASFPNAVDAASRPGHFPHVWVLGKDGGVGAYPDKDCPFFGSYAGPGAEPRDFVTIEAHDDGWGYTLIAADGWIGSYRAEGH